MLLKLYWWDSSKFNLAVTSVIITYLVVFSAINLHIYHKVAIWHLVQAWARFALQCFSFILVCSNVFNMVGFVRTVGGSTIMCNGILALLIVACLLSTLQVNALELSLVHVYSQAFSYLVKQSV